MTDVLGYVTDVLQNINDGNVEYCKTLCYKGQHNEQIEQFDSVLKKLLERHVYLEKEVARYQSLLSENDSVVIIKDNSIPVIPNENCLQVKQSVIDPNEPNKLAVPSDQISCHNINSDSSPNTQPTLERDDQVCIECLNQCTNVALAVTNGDFKKRVTCSVASGPMLTLKNAINTMVDKVDSVSVELIHVAREVGEEGKLGVQSKSENLDGDWKDMMVHLNMMASNHSKQVRDIAEVCTAVAHGDLSKKITVEVKGETLVLKNTINTMGKYS
jgi:osomolarity two-component system, sensor histidine kinase NIK1